MDHHETETPLPIGDWVTDWQIPALPSRAILEGQYCRLEHLDPNSHGEDLFEASLDDPQGLGWTYLPYGPFPSRGSFLSWIEEQSRTTDPYFYAIRDRSIGKAVGLASYLRIFPNSGTMEVGHLHFFPRLQRTRAATEAMFLMMSYAFELGYRRYEWKCNALNASSRAAALRLGFAFEGIFRQAAVVKGRNRDTAWFSVIDGEWPFLKSAFLAWLDPGNFSFDGIQRTSLSTQTSKLPNRS